MRAPHLSPRQRALLEAIARLTQERGYPPTLRELARALRVSSPNGIRQHLASLERKGFIRRDAGKVRGIVLTERASGEAIPVLGMVAAGSPIEAQTIEGGFLDLGASLGITPGRCFAVRVQGESMIGEHIMPGDYVVLDPALQPRNGSVVAVAIEGAVTLKVFRRVEGGVDLVPAHPEVPTIRLRAEAEPPASVLGVAIAVVRRLGVA